MMFRGFMLLQYVAAIFAIAPPHPSFVDYESVHQMRGRLNITYGYEPQHLTHEHCRFLTEEDCQYEDEHLGDALQSRNDRRLGPSTGDRLRGIVILLRFKGHEDRPLPDREYFEEMFNGIGESEVNPIGSMKEYLRFNSMGRYGIHFTVFDWHQLDMTEAEYSYGMYGRVPQEQMQQMFFSAMDKVDQELTTSDWQDGYVSDWGKINHLVAIHSGFAAEYGPRPCLPDEPPEKRIWSQGTASSPIGWTSSDYFSINTYAVGSALEEPKCNPKNKLELMEPEPAGMGVVLHEYLHGFGIKDLYDQDQESGPIRIGGTGMMDIMSNPYGWGYNQKKPGHLSAFSRSKIPGWLEPIEIETDGYYGIQPAEISGHVYKISHNFPPGEYLLIENRQPIKWDTDFKGKGILIYHVDETVKKQNKRGFPGSTVRNFPQEHYMVSVVQADGMFNIEKDSIPGDQADFFGKDDFIGPGPTFPNTDSIQGEQYETGIQITVLSEPGFIMAFQVEGINGNYAHGILDQEPFEIQPDPTTTGGVLRWILSVLDGIASMLGNLVAFMPS